MAFKLSKHASTRLQQRGFREPDLELLQEYGTQKEEGIFMRERDVRAAQDSVTAEYKETMRGLKRLSNTFIPIDEDEVLTVQRARLWKQKRLLRGV